ncbi:HEAT repeat domain-containing protein [Kitasatospora sp. NPDC101447]|uniref:HEAT repeat domain-containing protein n=1 Tax=Kitasatospora sp. NPDC101447 TaxID=3364102 RepID=UPI0038226EA9
MTDPLIEAVRAGRAHIVREILWAGADPETTDADGVPVLCLAVRAFDGHVADALLEADANPLRPLPDGSTPLRRAITSGNAGLTASMFIHAADRLTKEERADLLTCARHWCEIGAESGLRHATGATGPAESRRITDRYSFTEYDVITLGGVSVYDGHSAVLTRLEAGFGVRRSFDDLLARAVIRADERHADWREATAVLADRLDEETWEAAMALRSDPDPLRRLFAADLVRLLTVRDRPILSGVCPFEPRALDALLPWAVEETHAAVLAAVLCGLTELDDPRIEEVGLAHRAHPDPRVRMQVPSTLRRTRYAYTHPEALDVLAALARDPDAGVRATVCEQLYAFEGRGPVVADILAAFLNEDDQLVRIKAVSGLADADDPRCVEGARLIGPVDRMEWPDTWLLDAVSRYEQRRDG